MTKISVIIPIYNKEEYLKKCIEALINQTMKDIEIICIDDCSTDNSLAVLNSLSEKHSNIKKITHDQNMGPHISRYDGVIAATGKYILFVDADDDISENLCEWSYSQMELEKTDILHFGIQILAETGVDDKLIKNVENFSKPYKSELRCENIFEKFMEGGFKWHLWDKCYRAQILKKAFKDIGPIKIWIGEDYLEMLYIAYYSKKYTPSSKKLYNYHLGRGLYGYNKEPTLESLAKKCTSSEIYKTCLTLFERENLVERWGHLLTQHPINRITMCFDHWKLLRSKDDRKKGEELIKKSWGMTKQYNKIQNMIAYENICVERSSTAWRRIVFNYPYSKTYEYNYHSEEYAEIEIITYVKNEFFMQTSVMLYSLLCNIDKTKSYRITCIYSTFADINREKLKKIFSKTQNVSIVFEKCNGDLTSNEIDENKNYEYYALTCNKKNTAIYLAHNAIISKDISTILEKIDRDATICAVKMPIIDNKKREIIEKKICIPIYDYVDTSVMIINYNKLSQKELTELKNYIKKYDSFSDAFNKTFSGKIQYLPVNWNSNLTHFEYNESDAQKYVQEIDEIISVANIVTYSRNCAPWSKSSPFIFAPFWKYAQNSPYYEQIILTGLWRK